MNRNLALLRFSVLGLAAGAFVACSRSAAVEEVEVVSERPGDCVERGPVHVVSKRDEMRLLEKIKEAAVDRRGDTVYLTGGSWVEGAGKASAAGAYEAEGLAYQCIVPDKYLAPELRRGK